MYSRRNASGGEQSDVHFCTCRARCRTSKLPAAQTAACLECVKGNPAVGDKLADEVMNLLMSLRAPRQALGGVARVWGGASNLELQPPPHHHTASQSPTPRPPSWTKSLKWRPSLLHDLVGEEETKKGKNLGGRQPDRRWSWISSFKMSELAEWEILSWQTFDTFLISLNSLFSTPFTSLYNRNHNPGPEVY